MVFVERDDEMQLLWDRKTIDEMRSDLCDMLINSNYAALPLAKDIGISPGVLKSFTMGISKPNKDNMALIIEFFKREKIRQWNKDRTFKGKKRMERL